MIVEDNKGYDLTVNEFIIIESLLENYYKSLRLEKSKFEVVKLRENLINLRKKRDKLLVESDWSQGGDVPDALKTKWQSYRQSLRDLPANQTPSDMFLSNITWPTKPS